MTTATRYLLASSLLCAAATTSAQEVIAFGYTTRTCGQYLESRRIPNAANDALYVALLDGYVTAYNVFGNGPKLQSSEAVNLTAATSLAFADKYCRDHPLGHMFNVGDAFISALGGDTRPYLKLEK